MAPDSGLFGLSERPESARALVLPVPFDATSSSSGPARGPAAILRASQKLGRFDVETGASHKSIAMLPAPPSVQAWNATARSAATALNFETADEADLADFVERINDASRAVERYVKDRTRELLSSGKRVCVLGGDQSVALGSIKEHAARHPGLGILHIDARPDLRRAYQGFVMSRASIMHNVTSDIADLGPLVQVGVRDLCDEEAACIANSKGRIVSFFDAELAREKFSGVPWLKLCERIVSSLPQEVYVSFDINGLDPTLCPKSAAKVPGGLGFHEAMALLSAVAASRRIVGCDLSEVTPSPDDEWDESVGAKILYKLLGCMLKSA